MGNWELPGWKPFTAPAFQGSPSEFQIFRELACLPLQFNSGGRYDAVSFAYRTEQESAAAPPDGTVARIWITDAAGNVVFDLGPQPITSQLNFHTVIIPLQRVWEPELRNYYALIDCSIPSGEQYTGLIVKTCYGLVPPSDGVSQLPGVVPSKVGQVRYNYGTNPAVNGLGAMWPEQQNELEGYQCPLVTFHRI